MAPLVKVTDLDKYFGRLQVLNDDLNEQLRPILLKQLKPGSRIVSHRFLMGDWKPDKTETHNVDGEDFKIHLWIVKGPGNKDKDKDKENGKDKDDDKKKKDKDDKKKKNDDDE